MEPIEYDPTSSPDELIDEMPDPRHLAADLDRNAELDRYADPVHRTVTRVLPEGPAKDALQGKWLGHPLHPMLTDLPIGFWTSAFVLDFIGGKRSRRAADMMIGAGVLSALPTAAAGWADWSDLSRPKRRAGLVHAVANATAIGLYALSFSARRKDRRLRGKLLSVLGATAATAGGYLGGHLVFGTEEPEEQAPSEHPGQGRLIDLQNDGSLAASQL